MGNNTVARLAYLKISARFVQKEEASQSYLNPNARTGHVKNSNSLTTHNNICWVITVSVHGQPKPFKSWQVVPKVGR